MKKLILILLLISQYAFSQGIDNGKQINSALKVGIKIPVSGVTYSAEASQYFARMTVKPSADTLAMIAEFIDSLKLCGVWDKLDVLCLLANSDTTNALLNLKGSSFTGIRIGSPTFTPYKGITGASGKYINSQYNTADSTNHLFRLNSASFGVYTTNAGSGRCGNYVNTGGGSYATIFFNISFVTLNSNALNVTGNNGVGLITTTRNNSTQVTHYRGATGQTVSGNSVQLNNLNMFFLANNMSGAAGDFSTNELSLYFIGGGLTAQNVIDFNSAVTKLKTKIGF